MFRSISWVIPFLLCITPTVADVEDNGVDEGPFKVYRIVPTTNDQLTSMIRIFENADGEEADFWHPPSVVNSTIDVMVSPNYTGQFEEYLKKDEFIYNVAIQDLKKMLIEKEVSPSLSRSQRSRYFVSRLNADVGITGGLVMGEYYSYGQLTDWMKRIADRMPRLATVVDIGKSYEGRSIIGLKFGRDDGRKKVVVIDAGIHAREWAAVHTAMYFINLVANGHDTDPFLRDYMENLVIYIFPILNPDGYEYTRTDRTNPRSRMWRKSRSLSRCAWDGQSTKCCKGVDLNRNFDFRFSEIGASRYPCSEIYHGEAAFSEPETRAYADFLTSLSGRLEAYITLHAYSQLWIYSYSHRKFTYPGNIDELRRVAAKAVSELTKQFGTRYQIGTGPEIIYAFSGGSTDWATSTLKVKYSYTIELRPTYEEWNGFVLDKNQLIPTAKETWAGVKVVIDEVNNQWKNEQGRQQMASDARGRCVDHLAGCPSWVSANPDICKTSPGTMLRDCPKSCDICHLLIN